MSAKTTRRRSLPVILMLAALLMAVGALMNTAAESQGSQIRFEEMTAEVALLDLDGFAFAGRDPCANQCFTDWDCAAPWPEFPPICNAAQNCGCLLCNGQWGCYKWFEKAD